MTVTSAVSKEVRLSHPDKVMYPKVGFKKKDVAHYYLAVGKVLLPHLHGHPMTLKRYPDGIDGPFFYERRCPMHRPAWVETATVKSSSFAEGVHHCVINDKETLLWIVNLASLELHTLLSTQDHVDRPTQLMFDLDPGETTGILKCAEVALELRKMFDSFGLQAVLKTSGSKGLHFSVPLNTPTTYEETKRFAHSVALLMEKKFPQLVVSNMAKSLRVGKVLVDWSQNDNHKTTVAPYSLRAQPTPTVSTPISWKELETALQKKDPARLKFEANDLPARIAKVGDLFSPLLKLKQKLPKLGKKKGAA